MSVGTLRRLRGRLLKRIIKLAEQGVLIDASYDVCKFPWRDASHRARVEHGGPI